MLGRKQRITHEQFQYVWENIEDYVSKSELDALIEKTVDDIVKKTRGKRAAYAWSGGKDSVALRYVCELAGVDHCVFGMTELEFPKFLQWVTNNMPPKLEVINTGQDLAWLAKNPNMLFPQDSTTAGKWFKKVQHTAQEKFYKRHKLDVLMLGRRRSDGNYVGRNGENIYTSKGICRYSPISDWNHEQTFAVAHYYKLPYPPIYTWPRGFRVGTGPWAARQWTGSADVGWKETWTIDPNVVRGAAKVLPQARDWMNRNGLK